ncbi:MAG: hypothetical protein ACX939_11710, partial [Hyphococcus sp.]
AAPAAGAVHAPLPSLDTKAGAHPMSDRPADPGRNPFRGAQEIGKHSLEAAVEMFKALGGGNGEPRRDAPPARVPEAAKPASSVRGDLFDDQEDADLEIPSFLRKKKTG